MVTMTSVTIQLDLKVPHGLPGTCWRLDMDGLQLPVEKIDNRYQLTGELPDGKHVLQLTICDRPPRISAADPDLALIINHVRFQHIDYDFKIFSEYRPRYPESWISENRDRGVQLEEKIHSNYLPWDGVWYIEFETPIYQWAHRRIDLGWLI